MRRLFVLVCALVVSVSAMSAEVVSVESWSNGEYYACYDNGERVRISEAEYVKELSRLIRECYVSR